MTIEDLAGLSWFVRLRLLKLLGQELPEILYEIMASEMDIAPRTMIHIINRTLCLGLSNNKQNNALPLH